MIRGGCLDTDDSDFWIVKHPDTTRADGEYKIAWFDSLALGIQGGTQSFKYTQIGFREEDALLVEPRKAGFRYGYPHLFLQWPNPIRLHTNSHGLVEQGTSTKDPDTSTRFWIEISGIQTSSSGLGEWRIREELSASARVNPISWLTHSIKDETYIQDYWLFRNAIQESFYRVNYQETRSGVTYDIYSRPTRFFTPSALTSVTETTDHHIAIKWGKPAGTLGVDQYQYRIGHNEGSDTSTDPNFKPQTEWLSDWITICDSTGDQITETTDSDTDFLNYNIVATQPHPTADCGGGPQTGNLQANTAYRVQLRALDQQRTKNPYVRNYVAADLITLTQAPTPPSTTPTTASPTPTTPPITSPPATTVTTPTTPQNTTPTSPGGGSTPTTPSTQLTPTSPPSSGSPATQPPGTNPPATQPPANTGGGGGVGNIQPPANTNPQPGSSPTDQVASTVIGFTDSNGHTHETNIIALATMGVTRGCNPPENSRFCPDRAVTL